MNLEEMLGIDRSDPLQQRAHRQVNADWKLISELVQARKDAGLNQGQVAELMGVTQSAIARIESGARDPHLSTLRRYAIAVGVTIDHQIERPCEGDIYQRALGQLADRGEWSWSSEQIRDISTRELLGHCG